MTSIAQWIIGGLILAMIALIGMIWVENQQKMDANRADIRMLMQTREEQVDRFQERRRHELIYAKRILALHDEALVKLGMLNTPEHAVLRRWLYEDLP